MSKKRKKKSGSGKSLGALSPLFELLERNPDIRDQLLDKLTRETGMPLDELKDSIPGRPKAGGKRHRPTPAEQALELVRQAEYVDTDEEAEELCRRAIEIDPDCAEAYLGIARQASSGAESIAHYELAVAAAERGLGPKAMEEYAGHFWGWVPSRPYMSIRFELARTLWMAGRRDEAITHCEGLLKLNPGDNQGIRYTLANYYLDERRHEPLDRLLQQFDERSTEWLYTRALREFRRQGDSPAARDAALAAWKENKHVVEYLLGEKKLPFEPPETFFDRSPEQAVSYVMASRAIWSGTSGATGWLREALASVRKPAPSRKPKLVKPAASKQLALKRLPLAKGEVWEAAAKPAPRSMAAGGLGIDTFLMIVDVGASAPVNMAPPQDEADAHGMWQVLCDAFSTPLEGEPHRPGEIRFSDAAIYQGLREVLSHIGVKAVLVDSTPAVDGVWEQMNELGAPALSRDPDRLPPPDVQTLFALEQDADEVWQADIRRLPMWTEDNGRIVRPWSVLVTDRTRDLIVAQSFDLEQPTVGAIWNIVGGAMSRPLAGPPHRPGVVEVRSDEFARYLAGKLEPLGIAVRESTRLEHLDQILASLRDKAQDDVPDMSLSEIPGASSAQLSDFYEAAAEFYRAAPWRHAAMDEAYRLSHPGTPDAWYCVVMGQSGLEPGLAMYERLDDLRTMFSGDLTPKKAARLSSMSLMYCEAHETPFADLDAADEQGWAIAAPEAYPTAIRVVPGKKPRRPSVEELAVVEAAARMIVRRCTEGGSGSFRAVIPFAGGEEEFELSPCPL